MRSNPFPGFIPGCGVFLMLALLSITASAAEAASAPPELQTNLFPLRAEAEHERLAYAETKHANVSPTMATAQRRLVVHSFVIGGIIVLLFGAVLIWSKALQWQVQERTRKLEAEIRDRQRAEFQQAAEAERSRIARDLHDGLGTGLTELSLLASAGLRRDEARQPETHDGYGPAKAGLEQFQDAEKIRNRFDAIAGKARALVSDLDVIVWAIDPKRNSLQSFADYVGGYARELLSPSAIVLRLRIQTESDAVALAEGVRHSLFLAVKEALNNVIRHASATEVELHISQLDDRLHIVITDNGRGFDWNSVQRGNGLTNLQERLQAMRGECRFESHPGSGTAVKFFVPLGPAAGPPG